MVRIDGPPVDASLCRRIRSPDPEHVAVLWDQASFAPQDAQVLDLQFLPRLSVRSIVIQINGGRSAVVFARLNTMDRSQALLAN